MVTASAMRTTSFGIYNTSKHWMRDRRWFEKDTWRDTALLGAVGGFLAGGTSAVMSCPFELTKVRQQLDHDISCVLPSFVVASSRLGIQQTIVSQ